MSRFALNVFAANNRASEEALYRFDKWQLVYCAAMDLFFHYTHSDGVAF